MESGIYLMAHKSGLEGRGASGRRPTLQTHASDGERGHTALQARPLRPPPCPRAPSLATRPASYPQGLLPPWGSCADSHGTTGG